MGPRVVILAGGSGKRLAPLTRALYGHDLPKQFATLEGDQSLLQATIERALELTEEDRISVIVSAPHEIYARPQLEPYADLELLVQPKSLDTGPGMMMPLARVIAREPDARIIFLPSDHHVDDSEPLAQALRDSEHVTDRIMLLGVTPTVPETEYGWIIAGDRVPGTPAYEVREFHEKPGADLAEALWHEGGLWNTFITAGPARLFWQLASEQLPEHAAWLDAYGHALGSAHEARVLDRAYEEMTRASFSRDVLAHCTGLAVIPVDGTGWSDWGSPQRVYDSLGGMPLLGSHPPTPNPRAVNRR
ncbi:MAG: NTP transferase domain-containing protein [Deltaproteobacteria bacterium]|nr:NTP transferase domain-containing protein [Deltaproteobacteria bacterium]